MKYVFPILTLLLFSDCAQAVCFDLSHIGIQSHIGACLIQKDSEEPVDAIPMTFFLVLWLLINVLYGQVILSKRIHLGIKYILFIASLPLSPIIWSYTRAAIVISNCYEKRRVKVVKQDSKVNTAVKPSVDSALQHHAKVEIGEFTFDMVEHSLIRNNEAIVLEPKSVQVLRYLIEQQPRIISLEELHNNVWQDQVVTDTAVRRVISKLRSAFGDSDTKNPKYIKSVMKRGYRLVIPETP